MAVYRVYTEKKPAFAVEVKALLHEVRHILLMKSVTGIRLLNRYDIEGVGRALFEQCLPIVFFEPQLDTLTFTLPETDAAVFAVESLPGQFDARAASCEECVQLLCQGDAIWLCRPEHVGEIRGPDVAGRGDRRSIAAHTLGNARSDSTPRSQNQWPSPAT